MSLSGDVGLPGAASLSADLKNDVAVLWGRLQAHPFVVEMAAGTLEVERYLFYIEQNLLYLPEYARAIALGAAKSPDDATLAAFTRSLVNIVTTEIPQNERLRSRVRELAPGYHDANPVMAPATRAYASYLLATASQGDIRAIRTLILPCAWSYGDIAAALVADVVEHPVYTEWFRFFASDDYAGLVARMRQDFDADAADVAPAERARLAEIFHTATRLEYQFWEMGYHRTHWVDLA